ncbi:unnamed protein product [Ceutorhynchus assimilis]|uniref:BRCT domain-containing protein n=1 Tax=Ceutorhynchus assimilis TaxID=467358 RepID=A0A9N9QKQ1_9CUCU|nr:unnamed protein product [Ceutorhynchus assimilis]
MPNFEKNVVLKETRGNIFTICNCSICKTARFKGHLKKYKKKTREQKKICSKCMQLVGRGIQHISCQRKKKNCIDLVNEILPADTKVKEQLAVSIIKEKIDGERPSTSKFNYQNVKTELCTGGAVSRVVLNPKDETPKELFSDDALDNFKVSTGALTRHMKKLSNFIRSSAGRKAVPKNYVKHCKERSTVLADIYKLENHEFEVSQKDELCSRPVVFADAQQLIEKVTEERESIGKMDVKVLADGGYALRRDLEKYRVKAATSTPTRDGEIIDPNFSTISAVGQSICHKTHIDETITSRRQSYKRKADDLVEKIDIKKVKSAQHFLDGCSVFIAGFSPNCHEKLNKIINLSGATRYDEFSDRVSHVIVGDPICSEVIKIRENCDQCYLVSVQWLLDSVEQQKPAEESKYFISNSDETGKILSEKVINILKENKTITNESVAVDNDDVLTQKYLRMAVRDDEAQMTDNNQMEDFQIKTRIFQNKAQISNQSLTFVPPNTSTQISEVSTDMSETNEELNIFENLKFRLEGFSEEIIKENRSLIASAGGTVVDCFFKGICNYAIVPVIYNPKELLPALEIVNNLWLNENLETQALISDIKYYHRHINLSSTDVLNDCVVTISGYTNFEREFLQTIIIGLGGIYQEQFSKKTNTAKNVLGSTHLISPEASGKKYEAALRWNLPVTTNDWLLACAKTGKRLPLENYLIGESKTSNNETLNTTTAQKTVTPEKVDAPKTPKNLTQENFSQVTPINKILEDAVNSKLLPTPARPKQYYPWDPKTPETPLGAFIRPNPSPGLRKELQKYVNSFPDFVPPKRRLSRGEYSQTSQPATETTVQNQSESLSESNTKTAENVENIEVHQKLEKLQQMLRGSVDNTPRRTTYSNTESSSEVPTEIPSQPYTVSWDYEEANIKDPKKKIFLLSAIEDRERVTNLIESLGGQVINSNQYVPTATHLISPRPAKNEKTLSCMAAGKWILHVSYLEKSAEAGHFLNEEAFEFGNPKAKKNTFYEKKDACISNWRKDIGLRGYGAFHDMRAIIIAEKKDLISNVIQAGGGVVVNVEAPFNDPVHATHCLLEIKSIKDLSVFIPLAKQGVKCVNTIYVHDFLWKLNQNDFDSVIPYFSKYYNVL